VLGSVVAAVAWLYGASGFPFCCLLLLAMALALSLRRVVEARRRRLQGELLSRLMRDLEGRLTRWLRVRHAALLGGFSAWSAETEGAVGSLRATLSGMARTYDALGEDLQPEDGSFLEQIVVDPQRCHEMYVQVSIDMLLSDAALRALPAAIIFPATGQDRGEGGRAVRGAPSHTEVEPLLFAGIGSAASEQFSTLRRLTLPDVLRGQRREGGREDGRGSGYEWSDDALFAEGIERLRVRALPLHRYRTASVPLDGQPAPGPRDSANALLALPLQKNLFLAASSEREWVEAAARQAGSPDYLARVPHAGRQSVMYVRVVMEQLGTSTQ
jgi:hypothetical protein